MVNCMPYSGSKKRYAGEIMDVISKYVPSGKFYDVCGGGGAMTAEAVNRGYNVTYNELNTDIYDLAVYLASNDHIPSDWWDWLSKEQFNQLRKADSSPKRTGQLLAFSFGSIWNSTYDNYLFGESWEEYKGLAHNYIVHGFNKDLLEEALLERTGKKIELPVLTGDEIERRKQFRKYVFQETRRANLAQIQTLERLQKLELLANDKSFNTNDITFINGSYVDINPTDGVVYIDPPYRDSIVDGRPNNFVHEDMYEWFRQLKVPAFMSEYEAPRDFELIWSKKSKALAPKKGYKRVERLYWNGVK